MNTLGKNIKYFRNLRGYSQLNLGDHLKKSQNWVCKVEAGEIEISDEHKISIAEFLNIPIEKLEIETEVNNPYSIQNELKNIKDLLGEIVKKIK